MDYTYWTHTSPAAQLSRILPDGCRDVIVTGDRDSAFLTDLDLRPRMVEIAADRPMQGYRLRPGAWVDLRDLEGPVRDMSGLIRYDADLGEAIEALGAAAHIADVARRAGLSERTFQRQFVRMGLPPPAFWRMLGRARRAVGMMATDTPLAELAVDAGYSDQAHMTRDFRRWFGMAPRQLRADTKARADLAQPGLGNWTGEQISIR